MSENDAKVEKGTYRDPCPKCGARMIGHTKEDYIDHLRENGETLAAKIEEEMVVDESDCADTNPTEDEGVCADATGAQRDYCPDCELRTVHYVEANAGVNRTVAKKRCTNCEGERVERHVRTDTDRGGDDSGV
ncbi:hypothetical protein [Natrinema pallidum]|uniref:Uncharacterized protein n=1 Tax=Natrinema pallidum TaxID=69527 RepID=A0A4P9TKD8_9EURY|nr:hypothetical protein [Natrinema pallidum]QCW05287.1 hypothetical protein FGF80_18775 [Natrinema pallidum]